MSKIKNRSPTPLFPGRFGAASPARGAPRAHMTTRANSFSSLIDFKKWRRVFPQKKKIKEDRREYKNKKAWSSSLRKNRKRFCFSHSAMGRSRGGLLKKHLKNYNRDHTHWNNNDATYTQLLPSHMFSKKYNKHFSVHILPPSGCLKSCLFCSKQEEK